MITTFYKNHEINISNVEWLIKWPRLNNEIKDNHLTDKMYRKVAFRAKCQNRSFSGQLFSKQF